MRIWKIEHGSNLSYSVIITPKHDFSVYLLMDANCHDCPKSYLIECVSSPELLES